MTTQDVAHLEDVEIAAATGHRTRRDGLIVAALVGLAFALRAPTLGRTYWIDEGITVGIASHPIDQFPRLLRMDGSPPLFYVLLHFWMRLFGTSQAATHWLALIISLIAIPLAFWAGRDLFERKAGLAAAGLMATNPFLGWYSTETRMYTLVVVLAIAGLALVVRAVRDRHWRDGCGAVLVFAALLYTHNWGLYLFAVTATLVAALALARRDRRLVLLVAGASALVVVLWLPWVPSFLEQARNTAAPWAIRPQIGDFFADPSSALGGTLGFVVAPLLAAGAWWTCRRRSIGDSQLARLLCAIGVLTALCGWVGAQIEPSWTVRYLAVIVAPLLMAAAGALAASHQGRVVVVATCLLLTGWSVIGVFLPNSNAEYAKSNVAAVARAVAPRLAPGDVVVVTQTEQLAVLAHYLPKGLVYVTPTGRVSDPRVVDWRNLVNRLQQARVCSAVDPAVAALPVGAEVLEVNPVRDLGATGSAWYLAVNAQVAAIDHMLATDPSLQAIGSYQQALSPRPYSPVVGELFQKISGADPCR